MAVEEGFEPSIPIKVCTLSRGVVSATHPLHRIVSLDCTSPICLFESPIEMDSIRASHAALTPSGRRRYAPASKPLRGLSSPRYRLRYAPLSCGVVSATHPLHRIVSLDCTSPICLFESPIEMDSIRASHAALTPSGRRRYAPASKPLRGLSSPRYRLRYAPLSCGVVSATHPLHRIVSLDCTSPICLFASLRRDGFDRAA